jgi:hypothetical protein
VLSIGTSGGAPGDFPKDQLNRGLIDWRFGAEAAALAIELQSRASDNYMLRLTSQFRSAGITVRYQRIPNPHISDKQAQELRLDRASSNALKLLRQLGDLQAQFVQSECKERRPLGQLVSDIFSSGGRNL